MAKQHAKDYLIEFAKHQSDWYKALIYKAIETNGTIPDEQKKEIFGSLENGASIGIDVPSDRSTTKTDSKIIISKLCHISGVNALYDNQEMQFNNDVTIVYGLNGTGKSGYFRILNEIIGGSEVKDILPNIYKDDAQNIDVDIDYTVGNKQKSEKWDNSHRALEHLNKCKVFDSLYMDGLLSTRPADETLIQPLGLHLFGYIADLIGECNQYLEKCADQKRSSKPHIDNSNFTDDIKEVFNNHEVDPDTPTKIRELYNFSTEQSTALDNKKRMLKKLNQTNLQDTISLRTNERDGIVKTKDSITNIKKALTGYNDNVKQLLSQYNNKKKQNESAKKQFTAILNIPNNQSDEWKQFITAGHKYSQTVEDANEKCVYCRQSLDTNALEIVSSYIQFLSDDSENELSTIINNIDSKKNSIISTATKIEIHEEYLEELANGTLDSIKHLERDFEGVRSQLVQFLEQKIMSTDCALPQTEKIIQLLNDRISTLGKDIESLNTSNTNKKHDIELLEKDIAKLQENKSIHDQQDDIKKWFCLHNEVQSLLGKRINTRQLTELSKNAHAQLLTNNLKDCFNEEIKELYSNNLSVDLVARSAGKGQQYYELILRDNNTARLQVVLSAGEQKAVALALFISEIKVQNNKNTIVFDDPVTSLDHNIINKVASRLLKLNNQIIIFNHNREFLSAFQTSRDNHVCKHDDERCSVGNKGKHIKIFEVITQGKDTGILKKYEGDDPQDKIHEVQKLLEQKPFEDVDKAALFIRQSVECYIDKKIFKDLVPKRLGNANHRIEWRQLKNLKNIDTNIIDDLQRIYGKVSGRAIHRSAEQQQNPLTYNEIVDTVKSMQDIIDKPIQLYFSN